MATITVTPLKSFISGETVTPAELNKLGQSTVALTAGTIVAADIANATVTAAKLATVTAEALLPAGAVMPFAMNSAPAGWLAADGAAVNRVGTYAALFAAIDTTYGAGDDSTTFNLPDLRGYFVRGFGTNADLVESGTFGTKQAHALNSHTHTATTASAGSHSHTTTGRYMSIDGGTNASGFGGPGTYPYRQDVNAAGAHTHTVTVTDTGGTETRPANIALLYCIKF